MLISLLLIGRYRPEMLSSKVGRTRRAFHVLSMCMWMVTMQIAYCQSSQQLHYEDPTGGGNFTEDQEGQRNGRTFFGETFGFLRPSIFNIVRFPNEECLDASNQSGTCYTALECKKLGGNPSSKCARGLGTCCIMSRSCHNTTTNKVVYFRNPSFPLTDAEQNFCDLTVNIVDSDVCQLRLDFMEFQIDQPVQGDCIGDKFTVTASGMTPTSVPVLCGNNRNQHIYVTLPVNKQERSVSIVFETNSAGDYRWHLRVTQIDCRVRQPSVNSNVSVNTVSPLASNGLRESRTVYQKIPNQLTFPAPTGCLQYFTNPTGTIESFNFGHYLNNLDYAVCIDRQPDTCRIIYTSSDANFGIEAGVPSTMPGVGDVQCNADYLLLTGGSQSGESTTKDRYCGGVLSYSENVFTSQPVISKANGPLVIRFHSDAVHHTTLKEGFRVKYEQSPTECSVLNSGTTNALNGGLLNSFGGGLPGPVALQYQSGRHPEIPLSKIPNAVPIDEPLDNILKYSSPSVAVTDQAHVQTRTVRSRSNDKVLIF